MILGISFIEWFGYGASIVVAVSLMMSSIVKLRWYNLAGAAMFSAYGFSIGALPVGFLNLFIAFADIYYLVKLYKEKELFEIMDINKEGEYLKYYIENHIDDIKKYFPNFENFEKEGRKAFYLLKNGIPIGVMVGCRRDIDSFMIELDYVGPQYRDFKMGKYIYENLEFIKNMGYNKIVTKYDSKEHYKYLEKMGFKETDNKLMIKNI